MEEYQKSSPTYPHTYLRYCKETHLGKLSNIIIILSINNGKYFTYTHCLYK